MGIQMVTEAFTNFSVDFLLLLETNRLLGYPPGLRRILPAALFSGLWGAAICLPELSAVSGPGFRLAALGLIAVMACVKTGGGLRRGMLFCLLRISISGIALALETPGLLSQLVIAAGILAGTWWSMKRPDCLLLPAQLRYRDRILRTTALQDTGNQLRDPLTGERVLVAGAALGQTLLGLTPVQLSAPVQTLAQGLAEGGRLIPYHSVGQRGGLLLAMRLPEVRIGSWRGEALVAFSPTDLAEENGCQLLVGGGMG